MSGRHARLRWFAGLVAVAGIAGACVGQSSGTPSVSSGSGPTASPASAAASSFGSGSPASPADTPTPSTQPSASAAAIPSYPLPQGWRSSFVPGIDWGPVLAVSGDRLFMAGMDSARITHLLRSTDGLAWQETATAGTVGIPKDFVPRDMTADGKGVLMLVGELTTNEAAVPQIWRSTDGGTTFAKQVIQTDPGSSGEIVGVVEANGTWVAFGGHNSVNQLALDVWQSADGIAWQHLQLPDASSFNARSVTAWRGGFAALASGGKDNQDAVWLSKDGRVWQRAGDIAQFSTGPILALSDRLVVLGYAETPAGPAPAAWRSTDGRNWSRSIAPADGVGVMIDGGVVAGNRLVVVGMSHIASSVDDPSFATPTAAPAAGTPRPTPTAAPTYKTLGPTLWASDDAATWRTAGNAPYYLFYQWDLAFFNGHLVVATRWPGGSVVSVGELP